MYSTFSSAINFSISLDKVIDLSPDERVRLQKAMPIHHGVGILAITQQKDYRISGIYSEEEHCFAVDFGRPLEATLITFVHEMIHAADVRLDSYRERYKTLRPSVLALFNRWLNLSNESETLVQDIVGHFFFEMGLDETKNIHDSIRDTRIEKLKSVVSDKTFGFINPSTDDLNLLHEWIRAAIGLSVANEYNAYGLSLVFYPANGPAGNGSNSISETLLGIKSFLERLRNGISKTDDLSDERALELEKELKETWTMTPAMNDEILHLRVLLLELMRMSDIASINKWGAISKSFQDKTHFILTFLDDLGVDGNKTLKAIAEEDNVSYQRLLTQLGTYFKRCDGATQSGSYQLGGFWPEKGPFNLGGASFPLTMVCFSKKLHLVRQPGDYLNSMTTLVHNSAPEARIFNGSIPIRLLPFNH